MADVWIIIQTASAVVTAIAAAGGFTFAWRSYRMLRRHERVLFGEESVDDWKGVVGMVENHRERLNKAERTLSDVADEEIDL